MASERQPRVPFKVSDAANSLISVAGPLICSLCPKIGKRCKKKSSQNYTRHRHTLGTSPRACGSPPGPAVWVLLRPGSQRVPPRPPGCLLPNPGGIPTPLCPSRSEPAPLPSPVLSASKPPGSHSPTGTVRHHFIVRELYLNKAII